MRKREVRMYEAAVILRREEILFDVDFVSWKVAKCQITDNPQQEAEVSTDDESSDWINRTIEAAVDNAKSEIGYAVVERSRMQDNVPDQEEMDEWRVVLSIRKEGWTGNVRSLKTYLHHYVVNFVLSRWFIMVLPSEASVYAGLSDEYLEKAVAEVNKGFVRNVFFNL